MGIWSRVHSGLLPRGPRTATGRGKFAVGLLDHPTTSFHFTPRNRATSLASRYRMILMVSLPVRPRPVYQESAPCGSTPLPVLDVLAFRQGRDDPFQGIADELNGPAEIGRAACRDQERR